MTVPALNVDLGPEGELADDSRRLLAGRYGVLIALVESRRYFEMLGTNCLLPTQRTICKQRVMVIDEVLKRPHLRRLMRELENLTC